MSELGSMRSERVPPSVLAACMAWQARCGCIAAIHISGKPEVGFGRCRWLWCSSSPAIGECTTSPPQASTGVVNYLRRAATVAHGGWIGGERD